ncbi:methyl-accepting chemotaxis protein [Metabacillus niabensis]|uniref:Methyl-accepting chemotaxis protein n=1 Tax=Metabacillus niabensis TaxID=324854 RepID=A0ABT9YVQ1_9BACI|nr:methyl-accepting chemotaxis protein [Metabacillus niabensis]MDQ0224071.1 methyl-accepting chemotaxis protein [Metabacillus niabensis]
MKFSLQLSDYSLRTRLILVILAILVWLAAINCVQIYLFLGYVKQYNAMLETVTMTNSINGVLKQQLNDEIRDIAYGKVPFESGSQYDHLKDMYRNLEKIEMNDKSELFTEEIIAVREILNTTTQYIDRLGEQIQSGVSADKRNITYEYITILSTLIDEKVQLLLQSTLVIIGQSKNDISLNLQRDLTIYLCLFIVVILASLLFAWYISGNFVKPIRKLGQKTNEIAEGNLTIGEISIPSKNEIGDLCRAYNRMFHNLKDIIMSVRKTNDLVAVTSKDIHQSILENRLAGEEVAEATQTISINLHKQDELIHKSVATVQNLFHKYNEVLIKSNKINLHSSETKKLTDGINDSIDNFIEKFEMIYHNIQIQNNDTRKLQKNSREIYDHVKFMKLILFELNIVCQSLGNELPKNFINNNVEGAIKRIKELSEESTKLSLNIENEVIQLQDVCVTMQSGILRNLENIHTSNIKSTQIKSRYQKVLSIRNEQQEEIESIKQDIQLAFEQMVTVRQMIAEIEHSSRISKEQVVGIAAMGEEQLTTLEEVSDASYKLVERIQEMESNIKQFKL